MTTIVTRFAPSPTGFLHIGGARTALFNWLHARHHGGTYLLRIEDTDRKRSTPENVTAILEALKWLDLLPDKEPVYQFARRQRHIDIAHTLLKTGLAYHCYCTPEELESMRAEARREKKPLRYDGRWRHRSPREAPEGIAPVIRFKAPREGEIVIEDQVQGRVRVQNRELDDMILLRADGTPTYMLSVVVDDHDMGVSDIIRGDDHLTNSFRQIQLLNALDWPLPRYAHIPLLHGADGGKLSKRHGALAIEDYQKEGYLPEALNNYLLRLGWSHGDEEIISRQQAVNWFDIQDVGRGATRFDRKKLDSLNAHYLRMTPDHDLTTAVVQRLETQWSLKPGNTEIQRIQKGMASLKIRAKRLDELADHAMIYASSRPLPLTEKAARQLEAPALALLQSLRTVLEPAPATWSVAALEPLMDQFTQSHQTSLAKIAPPLRAALTGRTVSPPIFEVMAILGKTETLNRLDDALNRN